MLSEKNQDLDYVWRYLNRWDFPMFNKTKLKKIENIFRSSYYEELPSAYALAMAIGEDFLENSYDEFDLTDTQRVSDALLTAFVDAIGDPYAYYRTNVQYDEYKDNMSGTKPIVTYGIGVTISEPKISEGISVAGVIKDSPAAIAGILSDDVITKIDGEGVDGLYFATATYKIIDSTLAEIPITVMRDGEEITFSVPFDTTGGLAAYYGIGLSLRRPVIKDEIMIESVERHSPAFDAGIIAGDYITAVDGTSVTGHSISTVSSMIKAEKGTERIITVRRAEDILDIKVTVGPISTKIVDYWIEDNVGFIDINNKFTANTDEDFIKAVDYMKENAVEAIVYDLRGNLGGYVESVLNMLDYIAKDGTTLVSFSHNYAKAEKADDGHSLNIPSVIICDANSASASELFILGMKDLSAMGQFPLTVVGTSTYGKFVMQNTFTFSDGSAVTLTVAYCYSPLGNQYNEVGIPPDVVKDGIKEQLDTAKSEAKKLAAK